MITMVEYADLDEAIASELEKARAGINQVLDKLHSACLAYETAIAALQQRGQNDEPTP